MNREKLSARDLHEAISLGTKMAESDALAMLAMKDRQVAERDRRRPRLVVDNTRIKIITGPTKCSGDVARVIELPDGTGRIEMWEKGVGWVDAAGRVKLHEFMPGAGLPVSAADAARLGIPTSEIGEFHCISRSPPPGTVLRGFIYNR